MNKLLLTALGAIYLFHAVGQDIPDPTFSGDGIFTNDFGFHDNLTDVKVQANGSIISCGTAITPSFSGKLLVMRQSADGTFDPGFNGQGYFIFNDYLESYAYQVLEKADGKLLVAGAFADSNYVFSTLLLRFNSNGTLDNTFGNGGVVEIDVAPGVDDFAYAMVEQADHKIVLAGTAIDSLYRNAPYVLRLNEDGSTDLSFGTGGITFVPVTELDNRFNGLALASDGKIVAAGHYGNPLTLSGQFDFDALVVRLNSDGSFDNSFSGDGILTDVISTDYVDQLYGVAITDSGTVIVSGFTTLPDFSYDAIVLHYNTDGSRNTSFATNGLFTYDNGAMDVSYDLTLDAQGRLIVAGTSGDFSLDNRDVLLMRLLADGTPDAAFGSAGVVLTEILQHADEANAVTMQTDGKIIVAGKANSGTNNDACVVRYSDQLNVNETENITFACFPNPVSSGQQVFIATSGNQYATKCDWSLETLSGNMLTSGIIDFSNEMTVQIPAGLASGMYFMRINGTTTRLLIR